MAQAEGNIQGEKGIHSYMYKIQIEENLERVT